MNLQIFGTKKCKETKKAELFFQERRIPFQKINILEKPMAKGEMQSVLSSVSAEDLIDTESVEYKNSHLQFMKFDIVEKLLQNPKLMKTPVVRDGRKATVGYKPEIWKQWIESSK